MAPAVEHNNEVVVEGNENIEEGCNDPSLH
jgi:hypothetical protein